MVRVGPVEMMRLFGLEPDPWQIEVLQSTHPRLLLNCCRQSGKSTTAAVLALAQALNEFRSLALIVSRSIRQAAELFRTLTEFHRRLGEPMKDRRNATQLTLKYGSRVVCLPCREDTIRGFAGVNLMIIDEAARVPDDLYRAVRPMLAVSKGRLLCLSTPYGKRGFFWDAWSKGGDDFARIEVPAGRCPRIGPEFLEAERRAMGESWYRQEYACSFEALEGLVFPAFDRCVVPVLPASVEGRRVGGIDFGFRNPFAAVWGILDRDHVLWLTGEHYGREEPLSHHLTYLPRDVTWYVDPSGANERAEMRRAGFMVCPGKNPVREGIQAIRARLEAGKLRIVAGACPNLLSEAALYRYGADPAERKAEIPVDEHNHAIAALRYLLSKLDARGLGAGSQSEPAGVDDRRDRPPKPVAEAAWTPVWRP